MIVCEIAMISFIANFPRLYGKDRGPSALTIFQERTTDVAEIAARSRYALFLPLLRAGVQRPLLGSGYGSTVTFTSYEPRITGKSESATYTTFAFEWGYLDLFYKSGLLGLVIVIGFLLSLLLESFPRQSTRGDESEIIVNQWIFFAICALAITHIFSPYLNHPIGIGFVVLSASCLFVLRRTRRIEINS
jgi:O-antigen ligase